MNELALFVYGTLADPAVQESLFGRRVESRAATLRGWAVVVDSDGFFALRPAKEAEVCGELLPLTQGELWHADQWEEVPFYVREVLEVDTGDGHREKAWVYVRPGADGPRAKPGTTAGVPSASVLQLAAQTGRSAAESPFGFVDVYILVPCWRASGSERPEPEAAVGGWKSYVEALDGTARSEFCSRMSDELKRGLLGQAEVVALDGAGVAELGRHRGNLYETRHPSTGLVVVTIALPLCFLPLLPLLDQMSRGAMRLAPANTGDSVHLEAWLQARGLTPSGTSRAAVFLAREPEREDLLVSVLAAESDSPTEIRGRGLRRAAGRDLAQYGSARIRAAETCLVEVPAHFRDRWEERLPGQALTIFVIELILLQDSALTRVNTGVAAALESQRRHGVEDGLRVIEELGAEFSAAMTFWDTRNFRYQTAQALSDEVAAAFGIQRLMSTYKVNKGALDQLVSVHSARQAEVESRTIDRLLLLLAMIQAIPTVYSVMSSLISGRASFVEWTAGLASAFVCLALWLGFRWKRARDRRSAALERIRAAG